MERINDLNKLELLRRANTCFSDFLARFAGLPVAGSEEEVAALLQIDGALTSVGPILQSCAGANAEAVLREQLECYRKNLLQLRQELGNMRKSALSARGRLFVRLQHVDKVKHWCAAARDSA